jgi:hypothetical protein
VIVYDLGVFGVGIVPAKADAELIVHAGEPRPSSACHSAHGQQPAADLDENVSSGYITGYNFRRSTP